MRCSFEETVEILLEAAANAEVDRCKGVVESVMLGKVAAIGTGITDVVIDKEMLELGIMAMEKYEFEDEDSGDKTPPGLMSPSTADYSDVSVYGSQEMSPSLTWSPFSNSGYSPMSPGAAYGASSPGRAGTFSSSLSNFAPSSPGSSMMSPGAAYNPSSPALSPGAFYTPSSPSNPALSPGAFYVPSHLADGHSTPYTSGGGFNHSLGSPSSSQTFYAPGATYTSSKRPWNNDSADEDTGTSDDHSSESSPKKIHKKEKPTTQ